jgi:hypothetical protein
MGEWIEKHYVSVLGDICIKKTHHNGCPMFGQGYRLPLGIDINIKTISSQYYLK